MLINYLYFNPTGNMTALVTSAVPFNMRKAAADAIMQTESGCEQVGFLSFEDGVCLDMTGGEFCGNATMCAAIAAVLNAKKTNALSHMEKVSVKICNSIYEIDVKQISAKDFLCSLYSADVPEGITHRVVEAKAEKSTAEYEIRSLAGEDAKGLMFLEGSVLTPLVYVPKADTLFWENSCASGCMATGKYLYEKYGQPVDTDLQMPGGSINVKCDENGIVLREKIRLVSETSLHIE